MISITKNNVIKNEAIDKVAICEIRGLSTDTKPTSLDGYVVGNGSVFIEIDTGNVFLYDKESESWNEV